MTKDRKEQAQYLLAQYIEGKASEKEQELLFRFLNEEQDNKEWEELIEELMMAEPDDEKYKNIEWQLEIDNILRRQPAGKQDAKVFQIGGGRKRLMVRLAAAAAILLVLFTTAFFLFRNNHKEIAQNPPKSPVVNDIVPGGDKAVLTLADGTKIVLDSAANGTLTQQGNSKVLKTNDGQLAYNTINEKPTEVLYNMLSTPRGGKYQLVLPDGSKVWLNAASSIHYPTAFVGGERKVEITGEAYFEVTHNAAQPFYVSVKGIDVHVLGTHFNVNSYEDEGAVKITLLEGSVKITKDAASKIIKPGEQALISSSRGKQEDAIRIQEIYVDAAIAWKNGRFVFQGNNIQSVMRQLARWYDVDVSYEGNVTNEAFVGVIDRSRYESIWQILEMLEKTRTVSFAISGHHIKVMPFKK